MLTPDQILARTKTVTRRMGWSHLAPGVLLQPVRKGMGLRKGEKIQKLGAPIKVTSVRQESLWYMWLEPEYGLAECKREGFPEMTPLDFIDMFCGSHKSCGRDSIVTRIEFEYATDSGSDTP